MGELHLEIIHDRLKRDFGVDCSLGRLQVAYREAPSVEVTRRGKENELAVYMSIGAGTWEDGECMCPPQASRLCLCSVQQRPTGIQ